MNARTLKSTEQLQAEALGKSIRAEVKRFKAHGTKAEAIQVLKRAGIVNARGKLTKHYKPT